jgi:hypothetical protein
VKATGDGLLAWSEFDRGGYLPAMEVPDLLVAGIRQFFRAGHDVLRSIPLSAGTFPA